jgi:hypothetical protein
VGDYVSRGHVATVSASIRCVGLTIPEQRVADRVGQAVRLTTCGQEFRPRTSFRPLAPDQRALTVEAVAPSADGRFKPGLFATALIRQADAAPALLVPATAVETIAGTTRVYAVKDGRIEERIVTTGETVRNQIEITSGVSKGDVIASEPKGRLVDGLAVTTQ